MNEYWAQMLKMWQAQQAWDAMVWQNMQACPWLFQLVPLDMGVPNGLRNY